MTNELFTFYKNALTNNVCDEGKRKWQSCGNDKDALVAFSLSQFAIPFFATYCYKGWGLSKDFIQREFAEYINGNKTFNDCDGVTGYTYSLYVGFEGEKTVSDNVIHLMWCNSPTIEVECHKCPILYVTNRSKVYVCGAGYNCIRIELYDESQVVIDDLDKESEVVVYKHSPKCKVESGKFCFGKVKVIDKELKL